MSTMTHGGRPGGGRADGNRPAGEFQEVDAEVLGALVAALAPVEPSAAVRERLLSQVGSEAHGGARAEGGDLGGQGAERDDGLAPVVDLGSRRASGEARRGVRRWLAAGVRVAAAVVLVGAGIGIGRWTAMDSMSSTEDFAHLNQAQDVARVTDTMPDGHVATLTWSNDMSMTALSLPEEMMAASSGRSLQVWLRKGGAVSSLGLYDPQAGTGFTFLDLMPEDGETIFITSEPKGGSDRPTGEALVTFDVNADGTATRRPAPSSSAPGAEATDPSA